MSIKPSFILPYDTPEQIDNAIIPNDIYEATIERRKRDIQSYFITHPQLMYSFVGYNGALKLSNQLFSVKKCGCFYKIPWVTKYQADNNKRGEAVRLTFNQQIQEYRYMIQFWNPSPVISNMMYLSQIALAIIQQISLYRTYLSNNLEYCSIYSEPYYKENFKSTRQFQVYVIQNFSKV